MEKFKATLAFVNRKKLEKDTTKLKAGQPFIEVSWRPVAKEVYQQWVDCGEEAKCINQAYFFGEEEVFDGKTRSTIARENLKRDLGYEGGGSLDSFKELIGLERILITEEVNGYERIKYVNDPNRQSGGAVGNFDQFDDKEFEDIFKA